MRKLKPKERIFDGENGLFSHRSFPHGKIRLGETIIGGGSGRDKFADGVANYHHIAEGRPFDKSGVPLSNEDFIFLAGFDPNC
jgi:hypothetical protein